MESSSPPRYRRHSSVPLAGPALYPQAGDLPPYVRRTSSQHLIQRPQVEHAYHLTNSKSKPWATLKVRSSAKSPNLIPTFFQHEHVVGSLELNLDKGDTISAVTVAVSTFRGCPGPSVMGPCCALPCLDNLFLQLPFPSTNPH
jgi:hypothetical protein